MAGFVMGNGGGTITVPFYVRTLCKGEQPNNTKANVVWEGAAWGSNVTIKESFKAQPEYKSEQQGNNWGVGIQFEKAIHISKLYWNFFNSNSSVMITEIVISAGNDINSLSEIGRIPINATNNNTRFNDLPDYNGKYNCYKFEILQNGVARICTNAIDFFVDLSYDELESLMSGD